VVLDEDEFARTLIPELFKHNNYASFVRQLNMYGFHKRVGLSDNSMRASERKNKSPSEYYNPYFKRGRPNLLWLIQKPKPSAQGKKRGGKQDDNAEDDMDDAYDAENIGGEEQNRPRQPLLLGAAEPAMAREELSQVHQELQTIRQQQTAISGVISKIRREHEQLYGQAAAFQELHSRHENSINAILTFLATIYNRSLEGNQDVQNLFAGAIPHNLQQQGSVVDVGDYQSPNAESPRSGLVRRTSKKPLLLHAPPSGSPDGDSRGGGSGGSSNLGSYPSSNSRQHGSPSKQPGGYQKSHQPGVVEEIYDQDANTPTQANFASTPQSQQEAPQADFMNFINNTNARDTGNLLGRMDFPEALSHLQNADGKSPLSNDQRNSVLRLIAGNNGQASRDGNNNNALTSPNPPDIPTPNLETWNATNQDLQYLEKTLKEQGSKVDQLSNMLQPLSPSGSIPGLDNPNEYMPPPDGLDFNQIFNSDDYFANADNSGIDFGNAANDFTNNSDFSFDTNNENLGPPFGMDGTSDGICKVESLNTSEATSPANTTLEHGVQEEEATSPRKRRRRN
jgi:heat shock transcription factor